MGIGFWLWLFFLCCADSFWTAMFIFFVWPIIVIVVGGWLGTIYSKIEQRITHNYGLGDNYENYDKILKEMEKDPILRAQIRKPSDLLKKTETKDSDSPLITHNSELDDFEDLFDKELKEMEKELGL